MAEVVTSALAEQLFWIVQLKGIGKGVEEDVEKLSRTLDTVRAMLYDADQRQHADESAKLWVAKVQDFCYEADGVLDEWRTAMLRSRIEKEEDIDDDDDDRVALPSKKVCFCVPSSCFLVTHFHRVVLRRDIAIKTMELNKKLVELAIEKEKYSLERRIVEEGRMATFSTSVVDGSEVYGRDKEKEIGKLLSQGSKYKGRRKIPIVGMGGIGKTTLAQPVSTFSTSVVDGSEVYGRDEEKEILVGKLLSQGSKDNRRLEIIPIVGMGGIGKTTLAQLAYNDDAVQSHFEQTYWVHVGDPFDLIRITKAIIEAITGSVSELLELESLLTCVNRLIQGKRFLLVLDEVWTEDWMKWEPLEGSLKHGDFGSRILVTTRNKKVAVMMRATGHMILLERLSDEASWSIFKKLAILQGAGEEGGRLEEIGREIVKKCCGVPLVVKTLGRLMQDKRSEEEWRKVLHDQLWESSDVQQTVFAPLLLSYYNLSPLEKRCLLYCSIFPTNYEMDKNDLIQLWMSQGYLDGGESYERGENFFKSLVMRSIIQNFENEYTEEFAGCKMNNVMHESVQSVARNKFFKFESSSNDETANQENETTHHYTLLLNSGAQIPISVYEKTKLRTLFVVRSEIWTPLNLNLLPKLACLRTLCLHGCDVEKLPGGIDKLMHLRYLNLSDNRNLKRLPHELCNLLNLQTLRLNGCAELRSLPKRMGKLVNLRHLFIQGSAIKELPKRIGRLTSLRILDEFIVPRDYLGNKTAMKLGDLNKLQYLRGYLSIRGIGNVQDAGDAERAKLLNKQNLTCLKLNFSQDSGVQRTEDESAALLEALRPPLNLVYLQITRYRGAKFPNWMVSLVSLRILILNRCHNCYLLPPLGKLPLLKALRMNYMDKVEEVGLEFLGVETGSNTTELESFSVSFPKLEELRFVGLSSWKQWLGVRYTTSSLKIMPSLRFLEISNCEILEALPEFLPTMPVQELVIDNCPILERRCQKEAGEEWHLISHIQNIEIKNSSGQ